MTTIAEQIAANTAKIAEATEKVAELIEDSDALRTRLAEAEDLIARLAHEPAQFGEHEVYAPDWVRDLARAFLEGSQK